LASSKQAELVLKRTPGVPTFVLSLRDSHSKQSLEKQSVVRGQI